MFKYIKKAEYSRWVDEFMDSRKDFPSASIYNLKDVQDHFALHSLKGLKTNRLLEIGGADCRVLRNFAEDNECWNAEKFEGKSGGPSKFIETFGVNNVPVFLGEYSKSLEESYFDTVFSISVVEHVPSEKLKEFFRDIARILKPGGNTFHAIDVYLFDPVDLGHDWAAYTSKRLAEYLNVEEMTDGKLRLVTAPEITTSPVFSCAYASNADREMFKWNKAAPRLTEVRAFTQSCSLVAEWRRVHS
jgi:SAM-dependent methyltransferase